MKQIIRKGIVMLILAAMMLPFMKTEISAEEPEESVQEEKIQEEAGDTEAENLVKVTIEGWGAGFDLAGYEIFEGQSGKLEVSGGSEGLFRIVDEHTLIFDKTILGARMDLRIYTGWTYAKTLEVTHPDGTTEELTASSGYGAVTPVDLADVSEVCLVVGTMEGYADLTVLYTRKQENRPEENAGKGEPSLRASAPATGQTSITLMPDSGHSGRAYDTTNGNHLFCLDMSMPTPSDGQTFYYSDLATFLNETGRTASLQALYFVLYNYWTNRYPGTGTPTYVMTMCSDEPGADWPYQNMITGVIWKLMGFTPSGYGDQYLDAINDMASQALSYAASYPDGRYPENSIIDSVGALYPEDGAGTQPMISIGVPIYPGYLRVYKNNALASADFLAAHPVSGAAYGIFTSEAAAAAAQARQSDTNTDIGTEGAYMTVTIGAGGYSGLAELDAGIYWVVEIRRPDDTIWHWDETVHIVTVTSGNTESDPVIVESEESLRGSLKLTKKSSDASVTNGNSCYDMTGICFNVYRTNTGTSSSPVLSDLTGTLTITAYDRATSTGTSNVLEGLQPGTYWVQEVEASVAGTGFLYDRTAVSVTVEADRTAEVQMTDDPTRDPNRVQIWKSSSTQSNRRITESSATFKVEFFDNYDWSGTPVRIWYFRTDQGFVFLNNASYLDPAYQSSDLYPAPVSGNAYPLGTIRVTEVKAPEGYQSSDFELKGKITIDPSTNEASFAWVSEAFVGKLFYETDGTPVYEDDAFFAGVQFLKADAETGTGDGQGDAALAGAVIAIYNNSGRSIVLKDGTEVADGGLVITVTTSYDGSAATAADALPAGSYYAIEQSAPEGYRQNVNWRAGFTVSGADDGTIIDLSGESSRLMESVARGGASFRKIDREKNEASVQGQATLQGAKIDIINRSTYSVCVDGTVFAPGEVVMTLETDENGSCCTQPDSLPYGTYEAVESAAPAGYLLSDWRATFQIREEAVIVDSADAIPEQIKRCDLSFSKVNIDGNAMAGIPFRISLLDKDGHVVESHVIVSDANGYVNTKTRAKTGSNVNSLDDYVENGRFTDESMLDGTANIWFGADDNESKETGRGSLVYGHYRIEELPCEANKGNMMLSQDVFIDPATGEELDLAQEFADGTIRSLGNLFIDLIIHPQSELIDERSGSKVLSLGLETEVTDTFFYDHLKITQTYRLTTKIYYEDPEGEILLLGENTIEFTPAKTDSTNTAYGDVSNTVTIDSSALAGGRIHAVDILYAVINGEEVELVTHNEQMDIKQQMLTIPGMRTMACDGGTGLHMGCPETDASVMDTVMYENLADEHMYRIVGVLKEAGSGETVRDADGNACVVEAILRISSMVQEISEKSYGYLGPASGKIEMPPFFFDATAYAGKTLVVTEILFDNDLYDEDLGYDENEEAVIIRHDSLEDQGQSVTYLKVTTQAEDAGTHTRTATVGEREVIVDLVTLEGTIPGTEYTVNGRLVYVEDCVDANGSIHRKGDLIARQKEPVVFTAEGTSVTVEVFFEVDSSLLAGISGVVFEDVYQGEVRVGYHHDYTAAIQTPNWPIVKTSAQDGTCGGHLGEAGKEATLIDTVFLSNLTVGDHYQVEGTLMLEDGTEFRQDGKALVVESEIFEATTEEMTVKIIFAFDASTLDGKSLVVFEKLFFVGPEEGGKRVKVEVSRHEDLKDEDQTVRYEKPEEPPAPEESSEPESSIPEESSVPEESSQPEESSISVEPSVPEESSEPVLPENPNPPTGDGNRPGLTVMILVLSFTLIGFLTVILVTGKGRRAK